VLSLHVVKYYARWGAELFAEPLIILENRQNKYDYKTFYLHYFANQMASEAEKPASENNLSRLSRA